MVLIKVGFIVTYIFLISPHHNVIYGESLIITTLITQSYPCSFRENRLPWSIHPSANWLCISGRHPLPRPYRVVLQVHAGKTCRSHPPFSRVQIKFVWSNFFFCLILILFLFGPALTTEAQIPDPVESHRGHPWKQLRIHRPHPASLRPSVGISSKKLAFWWAFCPLFLKTICTLWSTRVPVILLRGINVISATQRNAHSGFDVIGVNQDVNSDVKANWSLCL